MLALLYLASIVAANLIIAHFGASATIIVAFVFIGFDITTRDALHERWHRRNLWRNMILLIATGALLSMAFNIGAVRIALASLISFFVSEMSDALTYQLLGEHVKLVKINGSNIVSAALDSVLFITIAFGTFMPFIVLGQFAAKVLGGFVWSLVLHRKGAN